MKLRIILSLVVLIFFFGCSLEIDEESTDKNIDSSAKIESGDELRSEVDIDKWLSVINSDPLISNIEAIEKCIGFSGNNNNGEVEVVKPFGDLNVFLDYRYIVELDAVSPLAEKLAVFSKAGFLSAKTDLDAKPASVTYKITELGWKNSKMKDGYSKGLCFDLGGFKVNRITDYEKLNDQDSGVSAYEVDYEINFITNEWVSKEVDNILEIKTVLPRKERSLLINGPGGYFSYNLKKLLFRTHGWILKSKPSIEDIELLFNNDRVIDSICRNANSALDDNSCLSSQYDSIKRTLKILRIDPVNSGKWYEIKYKFNFDDGVRYATNTLNQKEGEWFPGPHTVIPDSSRKDKEFWDRN